MLDKGRAKACWKRGIFYVILKQEPSSRNMQDVVVGIDPGSKKEGYTVKSKAHTLLNIQADAVTWVKDAIDVRRNMRRFRRYRNTPCRQNRQNRSHGSLPPSTKARWQWKLRMSRWLAKLYPIASFVVEDVKAKTMGKRRWDVSFSPLEIGKGWFYEELTKIAPMETKCGWETKALRDKVGLKKTKQKMSNRFDAHCVDSWVLANSSVLGHVVPENQRMLLVVPLQFHRRQLHVLQCAKGAVRRLYGGTVSLGFKRGSLVRHQKHGLVYVGGTSQNRISLHCINGGERLCRNAKPSDCVFLTFNSWRSR